MTIETGSGLNYRFDFPVPGINQSSQQFRDNFNIIKNAVENLQSGTSSSNSPLSLQTTVGVDGAILHTLAFQPTGFALPTGEISPMAEGRLRYNASLKVVEFTADGVWQAIGGGGGGASTFTGDVTGAGNGTVSLTLASTGVSVGTYSTVVVDAKGRITAGSALTLSGDITGTGTGTISTQLAAVGTEGTYSVVTTDAQGRVVFGIPSTDYRDVIQFACSDETTVLVTNTNQIRLRFPYSFTVTGARATLNGESTSGEFKIIASVQGPNAGSATLLFEDGLVIDENLLSSRTSIIQPVLVDKFATPVVERDIYDDTLLSIDILTAGTGAFGLKLIIYGYKNPYIMSDPDVE